MLKFYSYVFLVIFMTACAGSSTDQKTDSYVKTNDIGEENNSVETKGIIENEMKNNLRMT